MMKNLLFLCSTLLLLAVCSCNGGGDSAANSTVPAAAEPTAPAAASVANDGAMLQGKWQSADDPKDIFEITGDQLIHEYDGKKMVARKFVYVADCSGNACSAGAGNKGCYTSAGEMDIECYSLVSISETTMESSLVGATGKTLKYNRIQ